VRRVLLGALVLWIITVAVFVLFFVAPHNVARLLAGTVVVEEIFGLPGLGYLAVQSITTQDLPVIIAIVTLASAGTETGPAKR